MPTGQFLAGYLLLPLAFGLVPAFLPRQVPLGARWGLWLALLAAGAGYAAAMKAEVAPFVWLALGCFAASATLSLMVLVGESKRARRARS